jgi:transposase
VDILNLPGLEIVKTSEDDLTYYITAKTTVPPKCCQYCGIIRANNLSKYGRRRFMYTDLPIHGRRTVVCIERQRYKCLACEQTFFEDLPMMDTKRMATKRLVEHVQRESLNETFVALAARIGLNEKTVRNIFKEHVEELEAAFRPTIPTCVGIDEVHLMGKPRCVITNLEDNSLIDMLPNRDMKTLSRYFAPLPRSKIHWVAMDMWTGHKSFVYENMRYASIVIDKFHVVKAADYAMEAVRKKIRGDLSDTERKKLMRSRFLLLRRSALSEKEREQLNAWLEKFPALSNAYFLREFFYDIYDADDQDTAMKRFSEWKAMITEDVAFAFNPVANMVNNWYTEIFNYWKCPHRLTNAYTESLNSVIRFVDRKGRGYSFEVLRARMLYARKAAAANSLDNPKFKFKMENFLNDKLDDFVSGKIKPTHVFNPETKRLDEYKE